MTFNYDEAALSTELNKIRLYIGDTNEYDVLLQDEEIALVQSDFSTFNKRCAQCCRLICAKVLRRVDGKFGNLAEKSSQMYERYKEKADYYDSKSSASYPWSGSIYVSDKEDTEDDWDEDTLVEPKFKKGMMDNAL